MIVKNHDNNTKGLLVKHAEDDEGFTTVPGVQTDQIANKLERCRVFGTVI